MKSVRSIVVTMALILSAALPALGQPLADRIPSDALLYIGWSGAEKLAPAYAQSHLKGVVDASSIPELFSEFVPKIVRRIQLEQMLQGDNLPKDLIPNLLNIGETAWKKPIAVYIGPLDYSGKVPMPKVAILCDAGDRAKAFADAASKLISQIPPDVPVKIQVKTLPGDSVVVISNFPYAERIEESLSQREQFKNAIKQSRPDPAFTLFFDAEKVLNVASLAINLAGDAKVSRTWQRILLTTGIAGVKRICLTAGFDGKDWGTQAFIDAPQPRMGILASLLDSEPLSDDLFKLAPQSSDWVAATRIDFARILADVRRGIAGIDPNTSREFEEALKGAGQAIGIDIQKDLFAALGDQWLAFNSDKTGHGLLGMTLINPLRNAETLEKTLTSLEKQANAALAQQADEGGPTFAIETAKVGDLTIHYFAIPALAPCWTIKNNTLYVSLFPQILADAADQETGGKSILANEDFLTARKRLGINNNATSISYMDLPKLAPRGYQLVLALQRLGLGFADMFGLETPAMVLPPLSKIRPHLAPSMSASWVDDAGWHYRSITPFPGAELLGGEQALAATVAPAIAAVAVPAMAQSRRQAVMVQNMNNMRQIGVAAIMYSNDHKGDVPPDLGSLLAYTQTPYVFLTPHRATAAAPPANATPADLAKWVNENSDYVYVGNGMGKLTQIKNPAQTILAYEKYEVSPDGFVSLLFFDGHVERAPLPMAKDRVDQQQKMKAQ